MIKRIGVDICNTIADVNERIRQALNLPDACFKEYGLAKYGITESWFADHLEVFVEAKPLPGAVEALNAFASRGIEICYITARPRQAKKITLEWLKIWGFPSGWLLLTKSKDMVARGLRLNLMIEDAPPEIERLRRAGVNVVVYRQPYNNGIFTWKKGLDKPCLIRFPGWSVLRHAL